MMKLWFRQLMRGYGQGEVRTSNQSNSNSSSQEQLLGHGRGSLRWAVGALEAKAAAAARELGDGAEREHVAAG